MTQETPGTAGTDRIEKRVVLEAPRSRVWRAIADAGEFGAWFGAQLENGFAEGATVRGRITTLGHEHRTLEMVVDRMQPERLFSFRWHPHAVDSGVDYSTELMTLVEFRVDGGEERTTLTILESGFDRLPTWRRAEAFWMNDGGWAAQLKNLERHVATG